MRFVFTEVEKRGIVVMSRRKTDLGSFFFLCVWDIALPQVYAWGFFYDPISRSMLCSRDLMLSISAAYLSTVTYWRLTRVIISSGSLAI